MLPASITTGCNHAGSTLRCAALRWCKHMPMSCAANALLGAQAGHLRDLSIRGKPKSAAAACASAALATPRKSATGTPAAAKCSFCSSLSCRPGRARVSGPVRQPRAEETFCYVSE